MHMHMICIKCKLYQIAEKDNIYMQMISVFTNFAWLENKHLNLDSWAIMNNKLHPFAYFKTLHIMKRYKNLHCCEVIIKIHVYYTVLHTSEDTVKLLKCFLIQCLQVCIDMWLFQIYQGSNTSCSTLYWNCTLLLCADRKPISLLPILEKAEV